METTPYDEVNDLGTAPYVQRHASDDYGRRDWSGTPVRFETSDGDVTVRRYNSIVRGPIVQITTCSDHLVWVSPEEAEKIALAIIATAAEARSHHPRWVASRS